MKNNTLEVMAFKREVFAERASSLPVAAGWWPTNQLALEYAVRKINELRRKYELR